MSTCDECEELKWYNINPTDPERYISGFEQYMYVYRSVMHCYNLMEEIPDMDRFGTAYKKVLEAFPCLLNEVVPTPNGAYRYKPQPITVPDFRKLYEEAPTISSSDELIAFATKHETNTTISDSIALTPFLFKIDKEKSKECPVFQGKYELALYLTCNHALADATSLLFVPKYLNMLYKDSDYKIPLNEPQRVPVDAGLLLPDECIPDEAYKPSAKVDSSCNRYLNMDIHHLPDLTNRESIYVIKSFPPGTYTRFPFQCRLTSCFSGLHSFMVLSLMFHQHPEEDAIKCMFGQPRFVTWDLYKNPFGVPISELCGTRVTTVNTLLDVHRTGFSVYELTRSFEASTDQHGIKEVEFPFVKILEGVKRSRPPQERRPSLGKNRVSNVGRTGVPDGIIKCSYAIANVNDEVGLIHVYPSGQSDGSSVIIMDVDNICFTREFLSYYLDMYTKLWLMAKKEDVTYSSFIAMPEYKKLCELLDVKMPDWMKK